MKFYPCQTFFEQLNVFQFLNKNQSPLAVVNILAATEDLEYFGFGSLGTNGSSLANEGDRHPVSYWENEQLRGKKKKKQNHPLLDIEQIMKSTLKNNLTCEILLSLSLILSFTSFISDVILQNSASSSTPGMRTFFEKTATKCSRSKPPTSSEYHLLHSYGKPFILPQDW